ncbi:hypothetical protein Gogos_012522 [Gossypium gossypioides]|uniref:Uncharacterized protein n=1 Tax=Gossypium gossypioides TaxID=34282 RepID=A0A7J9BST5_GOSGO|nr:hypothetical protein [Gossypium gossypioides]
MALILSRSLVTSSLVSLPLTNPNKAFNLRNTFLPSNTLNKALSCSRLRWKLEKRNNQIVENKDLGEYNGLIGQFGVGFYYAFLVAEKVTVCV